MVFHGEPVAGRAELLGESVGRATGLRWGVRQLGVSEAEGWRGTTGAAIGGRPGTTLEVSASAIIAFMSTLRTGVRLYSR